jgi:hypothetical protein
MGVHSWRRVEARCKSSDGEHLVQPAQRDCFRGQDGFHYVITDDISAVSYSKKMVRRTDK